MRREKERERGFGRGAFVGGMKGEDGWLGRWGCGARGCCAVFDGHGTALRGVLAPSEAGRKHCTGMWKVGVSLGQVAFFWDSFSIERWVIQYRLFSARLIIMCEIVECQQCDTSFRRTLIHHGTALTRDAQRCMLKQRLLRIHITSIYSPLFFPFHLSHPHFHHITHVYFLASAGAIMSSGRTYLSKSSELMTLSSMAASLRVRPFLWACLAVLEAAS